MYFNLTELGKVIPATAHEGTNPKGTAAEFDTSPSNINHPEPVTCIGLSFHMPSGLNRRRLGQLMTLSL